MNRINIVKIARERGLDLNEVAEQLFPTHKYPKLALNRIIAGESALDENQISKLSLMTNIPIEKLFTGGSWKTEIKGRKHTFTDGLFKAELDTSSWTTKIYHNKNLLHELLLHDGKITLSEYLDTIDSLIIKYKTNADFRN